MVVATTFFLPPRRRSPALHPVYRDAVHWMKSVSGTNALPYQVLCRGRQASGLAMRPRRRGSSPSLWDGGTERRSPEVRRPSREVRRRSPEVRRPSPEVRRCSPQVRRRSPEVRRRSPEVRRRSPEVRRSSRGLEQRSTLPRRRRKSDSHLLNYPTRR